LNGEVIYIVKEDYRAYKHHEITAISHSNMQRMRKINQQLSKVMTQGYDRKRVGYSHSKTTDNTTRQPKTAVNEVESKLKISGLLQHKNKLPKAVSMKFTEAFPNSSYAYLDSTYVSKTFLSRLNEINNWFLYMFLIGIILSKLFGIILIHTTTDKMRQTYEKAHSVLTKKR